jgi:hypothetical protein
MNTDHKDDLILLANRFAGIDAQQAEITSVDRLGFHVRLKTRCAGRQGSHGEQVTIRLAHHCFSDGFPTTSNGRSKPTPIG